MVGTVHFFNGSCTAVGPYCPVENSVYGYYPHLGINVFLVTTFSCLAVIHVYLGIRKKTYFYAGLLILSCAGEVGGYVGRLMLHRNPYDDIGFSLEICCLAFAPSFLAAAVHATLKHVGAVARFGAMFINARNQMLTCHILDHAYLWRYHIDLTTANVHLDVHCYGHGMLSAACSWRISCWQR